MSGKIFKLLIASFSLCFVSFASFAATLPVVASKQYADSIAAIINSFQSRSQGFATAAQGELADSAIQPTDLAPVATSGSYQDLTGVPTLGTAAASDSADFATAAQGAKADNAVLTTVVTQSMAGAYTVTGSLDVPTPILPTVP